MKQYVCSKNVFVDGKFIEASLEIEDGKITNIVEYGLGEDFKEKRIIPGLIDIHTHGGHGCETNDADYETTKKWLSALPSEGTTSLLISPYTAPMEVMQKGIQLVDDIMKEEHPVTVLGSHLEGPFISIETPQYMGAMRDYCALQPTVENFKEIVGDCKSVKLLTMACELDGAFELMDYLKGTDTIVTNGHSGLCYEQGLEAIKHGLKGFTHTFNAMRSIHHREVGTAGCSLLFDDCYSEAICDGYHVSFPALRLIFKCKPKDKVVLVTDSLAIKGMPEGVYELDHSMIEMRNGCAYLFGTDHLSGSTLTMMQCVKNVVEQCDVPVEDAVLAASTNPATYLGVEHTKGRLAVGNDADMVIIDDEFNVLRTYHKGTVVYAK